MHSQYLPAADLLFATDYTDLHELKTMLSPVKIRVIRGDLILPKANSN
jgi:hypothetical protein